MRNISKQELLSKLLLFLIVLGSGLRMLIVFQHNPLDYLFSDPERHWLNGKRIFKPDLMGASDPILYQAYIFVIQKLTEGNRYYVAFICGLLSVLMPWTFYRAGRENGLPKNSALWTWAVLAWIPSLITIYHYFMMETLLLPLVGLAFWMTGRDLRKQTPTSFLFAVFCWLLAIMTKPTLLPLATACLVFTWWKSTQRLKKAIASVSLAMIMLLPNAIRTQHYIGFVAPLGNQWITRIQHHSGATIIQISFDNRRWGFASPSVCVMPMDPLSHWAMRRAYVNTIIKVTIDSANGQADWISAYNNLNTSAKEWFLQLGENILLFLFAPSWPDCNQSEWDGWITYMSRWMWGPLIFFVMDCNIRDFWARKFTLIPVACTAFTLFLMFQNIATSEGRYRKPLEPLLILNLAWTLIPNARQPSGNHTRGRQDVLPTDS